VPDDTDPLVVASLISKGFIVSKPEYAGLMPTRTIEMSKRGKEIIRNIILQTEQSSFERKAHSDFSYDAICKVASKIEPHTVNWLVRAGLWN
jgi:hypothetical protein